MTVDFDSIWEELISESQMRSTGIIRRRLTKDFDDGLYIGIDAKTKQRIFLVVHHGSGSSLKNVPPWKEICVEEFPDQSDTGITNVKISLASLRYSDLFSAFARDLYHTLSPLRMSPEIPRALSLRLAKWHQFFQEFGNMGLSDDAQIGLFAELWMLRKHVLTMMPGYEGVLSWQGPDGAPHDFRLKGGYVEVKVTGEDNTIHVANEYQLDDHGLPALYLYLLRLNTADNNGITLPRMVEEVRETLSDQDSINLFNQKLIQTGYLEAHEEIYLRKYRIIDEILYRVTEGFPRLIQPPMGITQVKYDLLLQNCNRFRISLSVALNVLKEEGAGK